METAGADLLKQAWDRYQHTMEEMRALIEATPRFAETPQHRAKAYHGLMEAQALAYNFVMAPRLTHPRVHTNTSWQTDIYTLGQNSPDFEYSAMFLDGRQTYRLSGTFGGASLILLQVQSGMPGQEGSKLIGDYDVGRFADADGHYDMILSATEQPGNWVRLNPDSGYQFVLARRVITDPHDDPGTMVIERISDIADDHYDDDEFDPAAVAARIDLASGFFCSVCRGWMIGLYDMYLANAGGTRNSMVLLAGTATSQVAAAASNYAMAIFGFGEDEVAIVELEEAPDGVYWSFQLGDVWSRSLDFRTRLGSLNMDQIDVGPDGVVRLVLARKDPGYANWLDVSNREEGMIVLRNFVATQAPVPSMRVVKIAELARELPADMKRVTPEERAATIAHRRSGYLKRHGE